MEINTVRTMHNYLHCMHIWIIRISLLKQIIIGQSACSYLLVSLRELLNQWVLERDIGIGAWSDMRLLFKISVLLLTLRRGASTGRYTTTINEVTVTVLHCFTDSCLPEDQGKIRLTGPRSIKNEGAVQLCVLIRYRNQYLWHYIATQNGWTNNLTAANLACKELGLNYTGIGLKM